MARHDGSHDLTHIQRVTSLVLHIQARTPNTARPIVHLSTLLHDLSDRKYLPPGADPSTMVYDLLRSLGADHASAWRIQVICLGVSYSSEVKDPARVVKLIKEFPELAVVQDANRLDALGAVGVGRTFTFGGVRDRPMQQADDHFGEKLMRLEGMMKTDEGRRLARERTKRIGLFASWWREEVEGAGLDSEVETSS